MSTDPLALDLLVKVEAMIDYLLDHEPDRMERRGMIQIYEAAHLLRCQVEAETRLSDPLVNTPGIEREGAGDTEKSAAMAVLPRTGTQRMKVLDAVAAAGDLGRTDEELRDELGLRYSSGCARRGELVHGNWLIDSGIRRSTSTGQDAIVWVLTDKAREHYGNVAVPV